MKQAVDRKTVMKRLVIRLVLVAVYVGLVMLTFVLGKGHTLIIDNKDLADGSLKAARNGNLVSIDGREAAEIYPGERIMEIVKGQRHTVVIEDFSGQQRVERNIKLPLGQDMLLVSIPKLIAGVEPAVETFVVVYVAPIEDEFSRSSDNSFISPDAIFIEDVPVP
jgi:hypothetical protein